MRVNPFILCIRILPSIIINVQLDVQCMGVLEYYIKWYIRLLKLCLDICPYFKLYSFFFYWPKILLLSKNKYLKLADLSANREISKKKLPRISFHFLIIVFFLLQTCHFYNVISCTLIFYFFICKLWCIFEATVTMMIIMIKIKLILRHN